MAGKHTPDVDFGTPTGVHTHPATHPLWLTFADGDCAVCAASGPCLVCDTQATS